MAVRPWSGESGSFTSGRTWPASSNEDQTERHVVLGEGTMSTHATNRVSTQPVQVTAGRVVLEADLALPENAIGIVIFAHGSGSSRHSPRNRTVARALQEVGLATLLIDLLTPEEEKIDLQTAYFRFDIGLLAERLVGATQWLKKQRATHGLSVGYFGVSTGGGAALLAAAEDPDAVRAVVSRGGRPDLAGAALPLVAAPTLLIVGGLDQPVIELNRKALAELRCEKQFVIVPGATHLFEEPGTLEEVARLARDWFVRHVSAAPVATGPVTPRRDAAADAMAAGGSPTSWRSRAVIEDTYHGQWIGSSGRALDAPTMPADRAGHPPEVILHGHAIAGLEPSDIQRLRDAGPPVPGRAYAHVQMTGNYILGCIDTQTLDYRDLTPEEAHQLAWEAFGRCIHVIAYFDENEQLVAGD